MSFFTPDERCLAGSSYSWKSRSTLLTREFERMHRMVRHVAPEQFRNPAKPGTEPCRIVPTTILEYVEHRKDMLEMATKQMEKNLAARREAQRVRDIDRDGERQEPIRSVFGISAKVYPDCFSPVLCQPTMWSEEHKNFNIKQSEWPTQTELQQCGDQRENDRIIHRCGRYLPLPRGTVVVPRFGIHGGPLVEVQGVRRFLPLDEHGPIFQNGPSPIEIKRANGMMDSEQTFERRARELLGSDLTKEVGA